MNEMRVSGSWKEIKSKLKQRFANLTDDDLIFAQSKEQALLGRLQKKLGKTADELRQIIRDL